MGMENKKYSYALMMASYVKMNKTAAIGDLDFC